MLSGNRNFEGRVHPLTRANYLASPPLVVAYALAGTVCNSSCIILRDIPIGCFINLLSMLTCIDLVIKCEKYLWRLMISGEKIIYIDFFYCHCLYLVDMFSTYTLKVELFCRK